MERVARVKQKMPFYRRKGFLYSLCFLLFMILGVAGYYAYSFYSFTQKISKPANPDEPIVMEEWTGTERVNIALLGVDSRPGDGPPRSDSIMVLSIDPQTKQAALFSVLRDTYYKIPGYGFRKINEAYALGGPRLAVDTISKFMQLPIHYYVKTDFNGFANIVDVLGGINMYVEKDMYWRDDGTYDINLKQGYQRLNGKQALMYVRFRHDAMSDFTRTERQRKFLATLAAELKSTNSLIKLPDILKAIQNDVETNMSFSDMLKLAKLAYNVDLSKLQSVQLPPFQDSTGTKPALVDATRNGASVVIPDLYETRLLVHKTLNDGQTVVRTYDDQAPMVAEDVPSKNTMSATPPPPKQPTPPAHTGGTGSKSGTGTNSTGGANSGISTGGSGSGTSTGGTQSGGTSGTGTGTGNTNGGSGSTGSGSGSGSGTGSGSNSGGGSNGNGSNGGNGGGTAPTVPILQPPPSTS